jgi:predicted Zn-dependent protease
LINLVRSGGRLWPPARLWNNRDRVQLIGLDTAAVARALGQIAEREDDLADAFFERREEIELALAGKGAGVRVVREEGLAARLVRGGRTWLAGRDTLDGRALSEALRQVARAQPRAALPEPALGAPPWEAAQDAAAELAAFGRAVERAIHAHHAAFPLRLTVRRHRRAVQVVSPRLVPAPEWEEFWSLAAELPWGRHGALLGSLGRDAAERVAGALVGRFRARDAAAPAAQRAAVVLGPGAAAVLLHEAVAHALEADVLAQGGSPAAAIGVRLGPENLHVLDDPTAGPAGVRRATDDEGVPVLRRWLLRGGAVEQPLADSLWAQGSAALAPGAARRGSRHLPPTPRSSHLELLAGEHGDRELLAGAEGGLFLPEAARGRLDPATGAFILRLPFGQRVRGAEPAEPVGPCTLQGSLRDLLRQVRGIGREARAAGAGWCAKGGQKLPVWATTPALLLADVEIGPW